MLVVVVLNVLSYISLHFLYNPAIMFKERYEFIFAFFPPPSLYMNKLFSCSRYVLTVHVKTVHTQFISIAFVQNVFY